jgi:hypothetical protein
MSQLTGARTMTSASAVGIIIQSAARSSRLGPTGSPLSRRAMTTGVSARAGLSGFGAFFTGGRAGAAGSGSDRYTQLAGVSGSDLRAAPNDGLVFFPDPLRGGMGVV